MEVLTFQCVDTHHINENNVFYAQVNASVHHGEINLQPLGYKEQIQCENNWMTRRKAGMRRKPREGFKHVKNSMTNLLSRIDRHEERATPERRKRSSIKRAVRRSGQQRERNRKTSKQVHYALKRN
jgi:hypothetical protein